MNTRDSTWFHHFLILKMKPVATAILNPWTISFLMWFISFATDRFIFSSVWSKPLFYLTKILYLCVLIVAWKGIFNFYKQIISKDLKCLIWIKYFIIYFAVMLFFLVITWPGNWIWDDMYVLLKIRTFDFDFWQHYLTSIYYALALMMLPFPAGILIVQNLIISIIVGYVLSSFCMVIKLQKFSWFLLIPFILPPVIWHNLYPLRMSLYSYLELLLLALLIQFISTKYKVTAAFVLFLSVLTGVVAVWRSEAIYYVIMAPLFALFCCCKKQLPYSKKLLALYFVCTIIFSALFYVPQKIGMDQAGKTDNYEITSMIEQMRILLLAAEAPEDQELINRIDAVLDVEKLKQSGMGESAFWSGEVVKSGYSNEEYEQMKSAYLSLILRYPFDFLNNRLQMFMNTSRWPNDKTILRSISRSADYREADGDYPFFINDLPLNKVAFPDLRIHFLETLNQPDGVKNPLIGLTWNLVIPFSGLLLIMIVVLMKKKWRLFLLMALVAVKIPLIILTAPQTYFMYYLPIYLFAYSAIVMTIFVVCKKRSSEKANRLTNIKKNREEESHEP